MNEPTKIRLTGQAGILAAAAAVLGFHPADSLVYIALTGGGRVGPVTRMDLARLSPEDVLNAIAILSPHAERVIAVTYSDRPLTSWEVALVTGIGVQIPVAEFVQAGNGANGVPTELMAEVIGSGGTVLPDRATLEASVEYRAAADSALAGQFATIEGRDRLIADWVAESPARSVESRSRVAELITAAQSLPDTDRRTPDLLAALAVMAYRAGDGALSHSATERALRIDSSHRLSLLISQFVGAGIAPEELAVAFKGI